MVTLSISKKTLDRIEALRSSQTTRDQRSRFAVAALKEPSNVSRAPSSTSAKLDGFETEKKSAAEDRLRSRHMRRILNSLRKIDWLNVKDRIWLTAQRPPRVLSPAFDQRALLDLASRLETGVASGFAPLTLASSLHMRTIRQGYNRAILDAFDPYTDAELRTVTVIYAGWLFAPGELEKTSAAKLKAQFRRHLRRAGVLQMPGPLYAVLHGEFDPTSGRYQLHYHVVTTAEKAAALKKGLTAKKIKGYTRTASGASPVRVSRIGDRVKQLTYLAKSYWPSRPILKINGKRIRVRETQRILEPFSTQVLLWHDRQTFSDLVVMNDCWSKRKGGTEAMKRLYLFTQGRG